ncbi:hypothetical protein MIND_00244100 [Mycena indigotica]|uniref:GATA-type domain-containing protein n=1 Tax=Mycena indigotica TaxID=2126181 RepID=A0A8H6T8S3_9AGAR|nr:uncharacterized protein MIND_00244100 [Mycena indigotica]KAF7312311.1 hypothetical protein MIND_00244100 [Mycena indigotica]
MPLHSSQSVSSLPAIGQTRCYWAILNGDLQFIFLDPVLAHHLGQQAQELVGKSLISFVHPEEQASAQDDLGRVLESRTLHGSVTRVRFSRLSRVRRELGYQGSPTSWNDADKIALDSNYMVVDVVINWAAEGVVLCFIHAIVDLTPNDNDENNKTEWTNWCGTPALSQEHVQLLFRRLIVCAPSQINMNRVFQILANNEQKQLLISWPPDQGTQSPVGRDFAKLVEDVQIGPGVAPGNEARTSCTRRYKALQPMPGVAGEVESIFIPHGSVIFACHKVNSPTSVTDMQQIAYNTPNYSAQTPYYEQHGPPYSLPTPYNYMPQSNQPQNSTTPYPPSASYGAQWSSSNENRPWPPQTSYIDAGNAQSYQRHVSPQYAYGTSGDKQANDVVPAPRRRVSPTTANRESGNAVPRTTGARPVGVLQCSSCKATTSPEWRKGPSGKKELCNACGLRYARSRAKKEGTQAQRKRKEKGLVVKRSDSATPPSANSPSYPAARRNYDDSSFSSTGSPGGEAYTGLDDHHNTPSPPPPTSAPNYVHYGHQPSPFYSVPSPLSAVQPDRESPMHSPATHSPSIPSFERERELLPPATQLPTEPRRRSILSHQ